MSDGSNPSPPLPPQAFIDIQVPKGHHKFVLGKSGNKLKGIENMTATKITVPKSEDPSDTIKISGTKEGIDRARHEILTISEEQVSLLQCCVSQQMCVPGPLRLFYYFLLEKVLLALFNKQINVLNDVHMYVGMYVGI